MPPMMKATSVDRYARQQKCFRHRPAIIRSNCFSKRDLLYVVCGDQRVAKSGRQSTGKLNHSCSRVLDALLDAEENDRQRRRKVNAHQQGDNLPSLPFCRKMTVARYRRSRGRSGLANIEGGWITCRPQRQCTASPVNCLAPYRVFFGVRPKETMFQSCFHKAAPPDDPENGRVEYRIVRCQQKDISIPRDNG